MSYNPKAITLPDNPPSWYAPDAVIWIGDDDAAKKAAYAEQVSSGADYLIREVHAYQTGRPRPRTAQDLCDIVQHGIDEHTLIRNHGIYVPRIDWHIAHVQDKYRAVARVAIIQGARLSNAAFPNTYAAHYARIMRARMQSGLADIKPEQCVFGHTRVRTPEQVAVPGLYMVDADIRLKPAR